MADYSIPEILDYLLSFKLQDLSLFSYHIYYQSTHTNPYQTHYFQTIITTTNISIITFFQSFIHIIHYPFIKIQYHNQNTINSVLLIQLHHSATTFISIHIHFHSYLTILLYSTIISSFLFNITEYNHGISFSSFISYFHLYLHSHIISILFISHNSSSSFLSLHQSINLL